ncbi:MAG: methyltransferase [Alphaproteobacteria bacterium]|nr:methyltransferase [Alphaproteobacteria bacterium]
MDFDGDSVTCDQFLDGALTVLQPRDGYRAATDPVLLAAAVRATRDQSVLELGCGVGVAALCLWKRVGSCDLTGVEIQPEYAAIAVENARLNGASLRVATADITALPQEITARSYDHVMINPPFFGANNGTRATNTGRETAFREVTPLSSWINIGIKRLKPKGFLTMIHLAERLPDILALMHPRLGDIEVKPLTPRSGKAASRVILRGRKGARGRFLLYAPMVMHEGHAHDTDRDSTSSEARLILRAGEALEF